MSQQTRRFGKLLIISILAAIVFVPPTPVHSAPWQNKTTFPTVSNGRLREFVRKHVEDGQEHPGTRIVSASVPTSKTGISVQLVYITGPLWCGSGGCTLLILEDNGSAYKVLGDVAIVQLPVRLLRMTTKGYPDIGVRVYGGGIMEAYEAELAFDGTSYPENPSLVKARSTKKEGRVIISKQSKSEPLY